SRLRGALPPWLGSSRLMIRWEGKAEENEGKCQMRAAVAARALIALGDDARPALPLLVGSFRKPGRPFEHYRAAEVLVGLGRVALPEVLKGLADPRFANKLGLALVIGRIPRVGEAGVPAVPFLCDGLRQPHPGVRNPCADILGNLAVSPELAIPS